MGRTSTHADYKTASTVHALRSHAHTPRLSATRRTTARPDVALDAARSRATRSLPARSERARLLVSSSLSPSICSRHSRLHDGTSSRPPLAERQAVEGPTACGIGRTDSSSSRACCCPAVLTAARCREASLSLSGPPPAARARRTATASAPDRDGVRKRRATSSQRHPECVRVTRTRRVWLRAALLQQRPRSVGAVAPHALATRYRGARRSKIARGSNGRTSAPDVHPSHGAGASSALRARPVDGNSSRGGVSRR
jgi:hypothetical protein